MRRIAFAFAAVFGCALAVLAIAAEIGAGAVTPAEAIGPTYTATNPGPLSADGLTVTDTSSGFNSTGLFVLTNAPGCAAPVIVSETYSNTGGPVPMRQYTTVTVLQWPTVCIAPGDSVSVQYAGAFNAPIFPFYAPPSGVFSAGGIPNASATPLPTSTPTATLTPTPCPGVCPTATSTPSPPPTATASPTPTPTTVIPPTPCGASCPIPTGYTLAVDCDPAIAGIQNSCNVNIGGPPVDVDVVFVNNSGTTTTTGTYDYRAHNSDSSRLAPLPPVGTNTNGNPDHNSALVGTWQCARAIPDTGEDGPGKSVSWASCYSNSSGPAVANGASVVLSTVHYAVPNAASPGSTTLTISDAQVANNFPQTFTSCAPLGDGVPLNCVPAQVNVLPPLAGTPTNTPTPMSTAPPATATPTSAGIGATPTTTPTSSYFFAIDCDTSVPGLQTECTYPNTAGNVDVAVVFFNNNPTAVTIAPFDFKVHDSSTARLNPLPGVDGDRNANPDFNEADMTGNYVCSLPPPRPDTGEDGPGKAASQLDCFNAGGASQHGPTMPAYSSIVLGRVHYNIPLAAPAGPATFSLTFTHVADWPSVNELGVCPGTGSDPLVPCLPATINIVPPPPTATATPTNTPTPPPAVVKVPEGNGNNTNASVPAANLWLCIVGPCSGPGEGNLIVTEHASNVHTGDQNGDSIEDGLGAYEFSVEYDNFVIQSVNPCDVVFSPGGLGAARGNVTQLASSAGCATNPTPINGQCTQSLILENIIHFGCVTLGQVPGPTGDFDIARLNLIPHPDLRNDIFPGNDNGVLTVIKDNGCELVDVFGHAITGSVNGGLTPVWGDLAVTVRILEGDLNLDCAVNVTDEQLIAFRYGSFFGSALYNKWFDLEPALHDLDIDIKDLQKVFGRDGSTCQLPIPPQPPLPPPVPFAN